MAIHHFTSHFRHPSGNVYDAQLYADTIGQAITLGKSMCGGAHGKYLYSRRVAQEALTTSDFYTFKLNRSLGQLSYRKTHHELRGAGDYFRYSGPHCDTVHLVADVPVNSSPHGKVVLVRTELTLVGVNSGKFQDFVKKLVFRLQVEEGRAALFGYDSEFNTAVVSIPLAMN